MNIKQQIRLLYLDRSSLHLGQSGSGQCCLCKGWGRSKAVVKTNLGRGDWDNRYLCQDCFALVTGDCRRIPVVEPVFEYGSFKEQTLLLVKRFSGRTSREIKKLAEEQGLPVPKCFANRLAQLAVSGEILASGEMYNRRYFVLAEEKSISQEWETVA